jgi:hypothetical protein
MKTTALPAALAAACLLIVATGCNLQSGGAGPQTWIDAPLDGMTLPLGPVLVRSHAASQGGTAQAALIVNGAQVRVDQAADGSAALIEFVQNWTPTGPGDYLLQVISTDQAGNQGLSNLVHLRIGDLIITDTPTSESPLLPIIPEPPSVTPSATTSSGPAITLTVPANCREGSSTAYPVVTAFEAGTILPIQGRNADTTWFWVSVPGGGICVLSGSTGTLQGPYGQVPIIPDPLLPATDTPTTPPQQQAPNNPGGFGVTELVCSSNEYTVRLGWNDVGGEDGYRVYRDGGLIADLGANAASYDDTLPDYNSHSYRVEAFNGSGTGTTGTKNSTGCVY